MNRKVILVTGGSGQVGWELIRALAPLGQVIAPTSQQLNLQDLNALRGYLRQLKPQWIVNAAAYTAVDQAEKDTDSAYLINHKAPEVLAQEAEQLGSILVHYSTDYVFDGDKESPYTEADSPAPINIYGASKWAGEQAVAASCVRHLIFRTSWVYAARGKNFLLTMLRLAQERDELSIVADQHGTPTWARMIAEATAQTLVSSHYNPDLWGTYHLTNQGEGSWYSFAEKIILLSQIEHPAHLKPITTVEYPTPAARPKQSLLDNTKLQSELDIVLPSWEEGVRLCMQSLESSS